MDRQHLELDERHPFSHSVKKDDHNLRDGLRCPMLLPMLLLWLGSMASAGCMQDQESSTSPGTSPHLRDPEALPEPVPIYFTTEDRFIIHGDALFPVPMQDRPSYPNPLPVAVLLHGRHQSRTYWDREAPGFVEELRLSGFLVLALDIRGHLESKIRIQLGEEGHRCRQASQCKSRQCLSNRCAAPQGEGETVQPWEELMDFAQSQPPEEWQAVSLDAAAAVGAIHYWVSLGAPIDPDRILLVGAEIGANATLRFMGGNQDTPRKAFGAVLFSPVIDYSDRVTAQEVSQWTRNLQGPTLIVAGRDHQPSLQAVEAISSAGAGTGASPDVTLVSGTDLVGVRLLGTHDHVQQEVHRWMSSQR